MRGPEGVGRDLKDENGAMLGAELDERLVEVHLGRLKVLVVGRKLLRRLGGWAVGSESESGAGEERRVGSRTTCLNSVCLCLVGRVSSKIVTVVEVEIVVESGRVGGGGSQQRP